MGYAGYGGVKAMSIKLLLGSACLLLGKLRCA
jgi:hypothetical protein